MNERYYVGCRNLMPMEEIKLKNAVIRIHGNTDQERLKHAATLFLKKSEIQKKAVR